MSHVEHRVHVLPRTRHSGKHSKLSLFNTNNRDGTCRPLASPDGEVSLVFKRRGTSGLGWRRRDQ